MDWEGVGGEGDDGKKKIIEEKEEPQANGPAAMRRWTFQWFF
jgi:hypothetical protein